MISSYLCISDTSLTALLNAQHFFSGKLLTWGSYIIQNNWDTFLERLNRGIAVETIIAQFPFSYIALGGGTNLIELNFKTLANQTTKSMWRSRGNEDSYNLFRESLVLILVA